MDKLLKAVIIDDELHCIETLEWQIENTCSNVEIIRKFESPVEGLKFLMYHEIDLLFLDIEMPMLNGFELLHALKEPNFGLIFTTAYDEFAIKAIKHQAIDYLLKPIDRIELKKAVEMAWQQKTKLQEKLNDLIKKMGIIQSSKIAIPSGEGINLVYANEILRCESEDNYTYVHLVNGEKYLLSKTLKEMEQQLKDYSFIRLHQSHLVNYNFIKKYIKGSGGRVVLNEGTEIPVSRRKKAELLDVIS
ncbi:MAG: LytTR family DNA-binding domain-containing protein [Bacteroidota bacterium]